MKLIYSFEEIKSAIQRTIDERKLADQGYNFILGVARGGLVPACIMAYDIDVPVLTITYSGEKGNGSTEHNLWFNLPFDPKNKPKFLIVEDICDTGNTLSRLTEYLDILDLEYDTYTFCTRTHNEIQFMPRYYSKTIGPSVSWVEFPWDAEEADEVENP